ncbi:MAG: ferredoxin family protein [Candidatus Methanofastidiosia archaeon]
MKTPRKPLSPPQKLKIREAKITIIEDRCKGCSFCVEFCPKNVLDYSDKLNVWGVHPPIIKDEDVCVGCEVCEAICPELAIFLWEERK